MTKFQTALADLMAQGVPEVNAREILTAVGSPFARGEDGEVPPEVSVASPPPAQAVASLSRNQCATHTAGNCPAGCAGAMRPNLSATQEEHYRIERAKADASHAATDEQFRVALQRLGIATR